MAAVWFSPQETSRASHRCSGTMCPASSRYSTGQGSLRSWQLGPCPSCPPSAHSAACQLHADPARAQMREKVGRQGIASLPQKKPCPQPLRTLAAAPAPGEHPSPGGDGRAVLPARRHFDGRDVGHGRGYLTPGGAQTRLAGAPLEQAAAAVYRERHLPAAGNLRGALERDLRVIDARADTPDGDSAQSSYTHTRQLFSPLKLTQANWPAVPTTLVKHTMRGLEILPSWVRCAPGT